MWPNPDQHKQAIAALIGLRFWRWVLLLFIVALASRSPEHYFVISWFVVLSLAAIWFEAKRRVRKQRAEEEAAAVVPQYWQAGVSPVFRYTRRYVGAEVPMPPKVVEPLLKPDDAGLPLSDDAYGAAAFTPGSCLYCASLAHVTYDHTATCEACGNAFHNRAQHDAIVAAGKTPELTSWRDGCLVCGSFLHTSHQRDGEER